MNGAFYVGSTGLQAQQRSLEVIANNVANVNTTAFKRSEIRFSEMLMRSGVEEEPVRSFAVPPDALVGVRAQQAVRVMQQGDLRQTSKPFDLAIDGDGFLEVLGPGGETWLWRGGAFKVSGDGFLATQSGLTLKALIEVPDSLTELRIERDGRVYGIDSGSDKPIELGQLSLVKPEDATSLVAMGDGFYSVAMSSDLRSLEPGAEGAGIFVQGSLEASNVELTSEMVGLLLAQRAYAANAQAVQAGDQLMAIANGLRR